MTFRLFIHTVLLALLTWAAINSGRAGFARLFTEYSSASNSLPASERALDYNPNDPEAHYARALQLNDPAQAIIELERATALRPEDYFLWQELGRLREENGDADGAIKALRQATVLAPYYAQPHWQLGNVLLRTEQTQLGFAEMRIAATSDPDLLPSLVDLAYGVYEGDAKLTSNAVAVQNDHERTILIDFYLKHDCRDAAIELFKSLKNLADDDRQRVVTSLIKTEEFKLAYELWLNGRSGADQLYNGDFDSPISAQDTGFGWQSTKLTQTVRLLLDSDQPDTSNKNLRIEYAGNFDEVTPVLSQLIPVDASSLYQLSFRSRSENLFSAGLPVVVVIDATGEHKILAQSTTLGSGSRGWSSNAFPFTTEGHTKAIRVNLQRALCNVKPCPITGKVWFDSLAITKVKLTKKQ